MAAFTSALALTACTDNPEAGSGAYRAGKLGNGSFLFDCDDSVACDRWSTGNAADFPSMIASGSVFNLRFVSAGQEGLVNLESDPYGGVTLEAVAPYVGSGPDGFTPLKPGYGTVIARDARGQIVDFVHLKFVKPDALVVYPAEYRGSSPEHVEAATMRAGELRLFRVAAEYRKETIAGAIRTSWSSSNSSAVTVQGYSQGVVTIVGTAEGATTLKVEGAGLSKEIALEVQP